ncbi:hypothetical protein FZC78_00290 [Rossellomorea vietnamensis]|uniref:Uncharacterized protein n=1 Tax=Rossellomorea vietnamensis TaxID=218284 RepID=A0A5D4P4C8_9BACI|nr:hypothetical protein [Rossellomorea vietnamensis]TYS19512.1 hypothetical protein FZC78_00290 [Rossellomorea vietnamensis]
MENLIFLVIAGLVSMLFNRMKRDPSDQDPWSPRPQRPESDTGPVWEEAANDLENALDKGVETIQTQGKNKFLEKQEEARKRISDLKSQEQVYNQRAESVKVKTRKSSLGKKAARVNLRNLGSDDLVKGIVLSEVLGPPRAKKRNWRG